MAKPKRDLCSARGASMPEYALLLFAVLLMGAGAMKSLGSAVDGRARQAAAMLSSSGAGDGLLGLTAGADGASKAGWLSSLGGFAKNFAKGFVEGDFAEGSSWGQTAGQIASGFVPIYGQLADIRDLAAAARNVYDGKPGAYKDLALSAIAVVPGVGDAAKGILKGGEDVARIAKDAGKVTEGIRGAEKAAKGAEEIARGSKIEGAAAGAIAGTTKRTLPAVEEAVADSRGIVSGALRRGADGSERVLVHAPEKSFETGVRKVDDIAANTPVYRVQPNDLPLKPHDSPYFDFEQYGLPAGKYEALYVSSDKAGIENLRKSQGYFDENAKNTLFESTLGKVTEDAGSNVMVFHDQKLEMTTGVKGFVLVRKVPR